MISRGVILISGLFGSQPQNPAAELIGFLHLEVKRAILRPVFNDKGKGYSLDFPLSGKYAGPDFY